jgi:hypothetical protein
MAKMTKAKKMPKESASTVSPMSSKKSKKPMAAKTKTKVPFKGY